jgi:hypothetical protein
MSTSTTRRVTTRDRIKVDRFVSHIDKNGPIQPHRPELRRVTLGTGKNWGSLIQRADDLAEDVATWISRLDCPADQIAICHEGYPVGGGVFNLDKLCELGGIVKRAIKRHPALGHEVWKAEQNKARKLVCGKLPQAKRKEVAIAAIRKMAFFALDTATKDECDSIVANNYYRQHLGLSFVFTPEPVAEPKQRKRSKAA